jgi:hypothetical protein
MGDKSSIDFLPIYSEHTRSSSFKLNFVTYISATEILCEFADRFLIFSDLGRYKQTLDFVLKEDRELQISDLEVINVSDSAEYFAFIEKSAKKEKSEIHRIFKL